MRVHADDRRFSLGAIFPEINRGDINVSVLYPGTLIAWHRHKVKSDYMKVLRGSVKVGVCNYPKDFESTNIKYQLKEDWFNFGLPHIEKQLDQLVFFEDKFSDDTLRQEAYINYQNKKQMLEKWCLEESKVEWYILSENNLIDSPYFIPTGLLHGSKNIGSAEAILLYHITECWSPNDGDEERFSIEDVGYSWEKEIK